MNGEPKPERAAVDNRRNVDVRVLRGQAALVLDDVSGAEPGLHGQPLLQPGIDRPVDAVIPVDDATGVVGERVEVVGLVVLCGRDFLEGQGISAAARQLGILRHEVCERVEVGRLQRAVDRRRDVSPAPPVVGQVDRHPRGELLRNAGRQIPAVLPCVPAGRGRGIDRERRDALREEGIPRAATVSRRVVARQVRIVLIRRVEQIAVRNEVFVRVNPRARLLRRRNVRVLPD